MKSHDSARVVSRLSALRRTLRWLYFLAAIWAVAVAITSGFHVRVGTISFSSRRPSTAVLMAMAFLVAEWAVSRRLGQLSLFPSGWQRMRSQYKPMVEWLQRLQSLDEALVEWLGRVWLRYRHVAPLGIAVTTVVVNVAIWLVAPPLWLDEEAIALNIRDRGFTELGGVLWLGQSAPLGWLGLERVTLLAFGTSELALRLVPLVFGIALLLAAIWIGRRWMGALGASVLVLLCGCGELLAHYRFEVKHYTADAFWALLLPALAVWVIEGDSPRRHLHRLSIWWGAATMGQLLSNGGLLVMPAVALLLILIMWRRHGRRAAMTTIYLGGIWLVFFALHYQWSLQPALESQPLHSFWAGQLAPASGGPMAFARWVFEQLPSVAVNPAGTGWWVTLWASAALGFALSRHRLIGLFFASVPISAIACSPIVPMHERLALWIVPALYVGVSLLVDRSVHLFFDGLRGRRWLLAAVAAAVLIVDSFLVADLFRNGKQELLGARSSDDKHRLNDRLAVRWLMEHHRPGDVVMSTRLAWPAVWWYGAIRLPDARDGRMPDGSDMYEVHHATGSGCHPDQLRELLASHHRALVYLGFRDVPDGFDDLLLERLDELGVLIALKEYAGLSRAAVFDLHEPGSEEITFRSVSRPRTEPSVPLGGCIAIKPAVLW